MLSISTVGATHTNQLFRGRVLTLVLSWQLWLAAVFFTTFVAVSLVVPSLGLNLFDSPDENSNYIFTRTFAEDGRLWYEKDYLHLDEENLLHPRGVITHDERAVPFNFLGLPIIYGLVFRVLGESIVVLTLVLAAVCAWAMYRITAMAFGAKAWEAWGVALGFTPLIYYLNHPYMNATLAITFVFVSLWFFVRYYQSSHILDIAVSAAFLALSVFCRYEYLLFLTPLAVWGLYLKHGSFRSGEFLRGIGIVVAALAILFALPLAVANQATYGSFHIYGYSLFNEVYFPERNASSELSMFENLWRTVRGVLLPSYPVDFGAIAENFYFLTIKLMPVFTALAAIGVTLLVKSRRVRLHQLWPVVLIAAYMIVYRGSNETWRAFSEVPGYNAADVRYWLPFYTLGFFAATYALTRIKELMIKGVLILGLILTGLLSVYSIDDASVKPLRETLARYETWGETILVPNTEENAIIFAGRSDKRIYPFRDTAAWWSGSEFYEPNMVAASMARVSSETGRPVYLVGEREVDLNVLREVLAGYGLTLNKIGRTGIYKLAPEQPSQ